MVDGLVDWAEILRERNEAVAEAYENGRRIALEEAEKICRNKIFINAIQMKELENDTEVTDHIGRENSLDTMRVKGNSYNECANSISELKRE